MLNSHCVTPTAVIVKKFFMILQMTIFLFLFFFLTLSTRKIGNKLSLWKIKFTFPRTLVLIVSPSFVRLPVVGILISRVGREKYALLPTPPLRPFLTGIPRRVASTVWTPGRGYSTYSNRVLPNIFVLQITLTRTMFLLSSDRWKYLHFAARRSFTHSPLHYIYGTMVHGSPWRKIKKIWTGVQRSKINNPLITSTPQ